MRAVRRWAYAVAGWVTLGMLCLPVAAQVGAPQVAIRPQFRTAPRSLITQNIDRARLAPMAGAVHSEVAGAQDLGARDPQSLLEHIQLVLARPAERQAAFDAEVEALHQFGNPSYHQWLTPETIGAEFGPSAADLATLTGFLQSEGFTVNNAGKSGMFVDFTGTVAQVQATFHTEIDNLRLANGDERYSAVREAQMPEALAPVVSGFLSLSDIAPRPLVVPARSPVVGTARTGVHPNDTRGSGEYFVGAQDFYTIYNENPLLTAGTTGAGITVALLEQTDINPADVTAFRTAMGVVPNTPTLNILHGSGSIACSDPGITSTNEETEAVLDAEWAGAAAPGATLLFMTCKTFATGGIFLSAEAVIDNNLATTMSLSYGATEVGASRINTFLSNLWEQAAAQGQTVVISAGDAGSANTQDQNKPIATHGLAVNSFASTAYNVAAGGTDFQDVYNDAESDPSFGVAHYWASSNGANFSSALGYIAETTWNGTCASALLSFQLTGSILPNALCNVSTLYDATNGAGGGVSILQPRPSWQNGTVFGIPSTTTNNNRLLPDVSLFAAVNTKSQHSLDFYQSDSGGLLLAGGTSFVSPQLAGIFALIAQKTGERLGQPNYVLYNMAGAEYGTAVFTGGNCNGTGASGLATTSTAPDSTCIFYDVQSGNISQACSVGSTNCYTNMGSVGILSTSTLAALPAYPAGQGYDLATGLGSLNLTNLVNNWQTAASGGTSFTPTIAVTATLGAYPYGSPSAIAYTATASGSGSFPTGSVTFSGSPTIATIGTDVLVQSGGCSSGGTCTESATQAFTPPARLAAGSYTISAVYSSTNENYLNGSGTTSLTVNKQTPAVTVSAAAGSTTTANFSATIAYAGSGLKPSAGLTFQVDLGAAVTAACVGSSSPLICTYTGYDTSALSLGAHTLTATSLADGNYAAASGSNTLTIQTAPTIGFAVSMHHTLDTPFAVVATSNSPGALTYSVIGGPATVAGNTVTLTGVAGTVTLQVSQAASPGYTAATQSASFLVLAGSVWLGNGSGSLSAFDLTGSPITGATGFIGGGVAGISSPLGLAFDSSGNAWVANVNGVGEFSRQGIAVTATPYTGGGVSLPLAVAIDGLGQVWVANASGTVSLLNNAGAAVSPSGGYPGPGSTPAGIAIDTSGSVWIPSSAANTVTRILGAAAPVAPLATGAASGTGVRP